MEERLALAALCVSSYGWTMQNACLAVNVFLERFWRVKQHLRDHDEQQCLPSPVMDRVWSLATCFTREYRRLCGAGPLFEHQPLAMHAGPGAEARYRRTLEVLGQLFPGEPLDPQLFPPLVPAVAGAAANGRSPVAAADQAAADSAAGAARKRIAEPPPVQHQQPAEGDGGERRVRARGEAEQQAAPPPEQRMQIFVRGDRTYTLDVLAGDAAEAVKRRLSAKTGVPPEMLFLIFGGKLLSNGFSLGEFGVQSGCTLQMGQRPHLKSAAPGTPLATSSLRAVPTPPVPPPVQDVRRSARKRNKR